MVANSLMCWWEKLWKGKANVAEGGGIVLRYLEESTIEWDWKILTDKISVIGAKSYSFKRLWYKFNSSEKAKL